jgi:hypothetical protein
MANESSVLTIGVGGTYKAATGAVALVNEAGKQLFFTGAQTTRDTVRAEATNAAIGAIYVSSAGKIYQKIANAGATADWVKVTATAVD